MAVTLAPIRCTTVASARATVRNGSTARAIRAVGHHKLGSQLRASVRTHPVARISLRQTLNRAERRDTVRVMAKKTETKLAEVADKEAKNAAMLKQLVAYVGAAVAFGGGIWFTMGADSGQEFFAGYLLEQSLSIDNLFVFILIFNFFETTPEAQEKALAYGLWGAAVMRAVLILAGSAAVESFRPVLLVFAGILLFSSYKLLTGDDEEEEDMNDNAVVKFCRKYITVSDDYDGANFFTLENGVKVATPLLLVVTIIELSDVVFAVDSIPAVFGVTTDPFIVYSSNMFALLSLRALFAFVAEVVAELEYLQTAVALVLGFVGAKLCLEVGLDIEIPTLASLGIVAGLLGGGVAASLWLPSEKEESA